MVFDQVNKLFTYTQKLKHILLNCFVVDCFPAVAKKRCKQFLEMAHLQDENSRTSEHEPFVLRDDQRHMPLRVYSLALLTRF